jgi:uncharacterized membrane protein YfhO
MNDLTAPGLGDTAVIPGSFVAKNTAVLRTTYKSELGNATIGNDSAAFVKLTSYGLDELSFESQNSQDGLAVFSDIYYSKGWKAYVNGKETPIMRTNYVLRSILVPKGNNKIEFKFRPDSFYNGKKVALASSVLLILLCLGAFLPMFRSKKETV